MTTKQNAYSFTEAAECTPAETTGKRIATDSTTLVSFIKLVQSFERLLELHRREADGDETITLKEWKDAIANGEEAMRTFNHF